MSLMIFSILASTTLTTVTFSAAWFFMWRAMKDREKASPFECGFDPKSSARLPFSLRFFLLGIIFIVFDIEIVLIMPLPLLQILTASFTAYLAGTLFLIILMMGLLHEWNEGSLNWST